MCYVCPSTMDIDAYGLDPHLDHAEGDEDGAVATDSASHTAHLIYQNLLPYPCESAGAMENMLHAVVRRVLDCVASRDYDVGVHRWTQRLEALLALKYPLSRSLRAQLARLYFELAVMDTLDVRLVETAAGCCITLIRPKRELARDDLELPWEPLHTALVRNVYHKQRRIGHGAVGNVSGVLLDLAEYAQRFFAPGAVDAMLAAMLPRMDGSDINSVVVAQAFVVHFLPLAAPGRWLPAMFRLWETFRSSLFDDQMLDHLARLAEYHMMEAPEHVCWRDVGLFSTAEYARIMTKCLRFAGLPVSTKKEAEETLMAQSASVRTGADAIVSNTTLRLKKPTDLLRSFARIMVYSMSQDADETYVGKSRALDSLAKYMQATENYFHPSNWGIWQTQLSSLVQHLTWEFSRRVGAEERVECRVPRDRRVTPAIRREFVAMMSRVSLLSMFGRDPVTMAASHESLKRIAALQPELVIPHVLQRSFSSLEALETTHRTTAVLSALASLVQPMVDRALYPAGAKHLVPLLHLCLPGIDLNDPLKTISTCMVVMSACMSVYIDDESAETGYSDANEVVAVDANTTSTRGAEDYQVRIATSEFEGWVSAFMRQVLHLVDTLPEEGKGGRIGEKHEEMVLHTLLATCDVFCSALSPRMFDRALDVLVAYVTTSVSGAAVKVIGSLISCFSRVDAAKVLRRVMPLCTATIAAELEHGASSIRTTSTSVPRAQDTALHYHINMLAGALTAAGAAVLPHAAEVADCIALLQERCYSERSYLLSAQLLCRLLGGLTTVYPMEQRLVNPDEFASEHFARHSYNYWGARYVGHDVRIAWHTPSDGELDYAVALIARTVEWPLAQLERLIVTPRNQVWHNDFCRCLCVLRFVFTTLPMPAQSAPPGTSVDEAPCGGAARSDAGDVDLAAIPAQMGVAMPQLRPEVAAAIHSVRERYGALLVRATEALDNGNEDQIDTLRLLVRAIRAYLIQHGFNGDEYKKLTRSVSFFQTVGQLAPRQRAHPRLVWIKRASLYHSMRARMWAQWRDRSALDDKLVRCLAALSLSDYVAVRKTAQATLEPVCVHYDGARALVLGKILASLAPSAHEGQVKGALHVLGTKGFIRATVRNASFVRQVVPALLGVQHHAKPSIQQLVRSILQDILLRLAEPSVRHAHFTAPSLDAAAASVRGAVGGAESRYDSPARRVAASDAEHLALLAVLLATAHAPTTHWAFLLIVVRVLRIETRRDRPVAAALASLFAKLSIADNPSLRYYAQEALIKALYMIKLRTNSKSATALYLELSSQPLRQRVQRMRAPAADDDAQFAGPLDAAARLYDSSSDGWLMWSQTDDYSTLATEAAVWEPESQAAVNAVRRVVDHEWWRKLAIHLSQETRRDYPADESVQFVKSLAQVLGAPVLAHAEPLVEKLVSERDRHKHRAAAEIICGLLRGSKHWPIDAASRLVAWADRILVDVLATSASDSQPAWQIAIECAFSKRDPRRLRAILAHVVERAKTSLGSTHGAMQQANAQYALGCIVRSLQNRFAPWGAAEFATLYDAHFGHDYQEVRRAITESLVELDFSTLRPALANVEEFLATGSAAGSLLMDTGAFASRVASLSTRLCTLRAQRVPTAIGTSEYDRTAMAAALWITQSLEDHRAGPVSELAITFLPDLFAMYELRDNEELEELVHDVLINVVSYEHSAENANALVGALLGIIRAAHAAWRVRLEVLPFLQIAYFQKYVAANSLFLLSQPTVDDVLHVTLELLNDPQLEVREMAATTLSGIVRCSQRSLVASLRSRFAALVAGTPLPKRGAPGFDAALRSLHAGILGAVALVNAFPYDVPDWMPEFVLDIVAVHAEDPVPISSTVRRCAADFRRTHQDTWAEDQEKFGDRLQEVNDFTLGRCDYFV